MVKLPIDILYPKFLGLSFDMFFIDENGQKIIVHPKAKAEIHVGLINERVYYDEDGYRMKTADDIKDFNRRMRRLDKEKWLRDQNKLKYKLSKWGKRVVEVLRNSNNGMQNGTIMRKLYKLGYDGDAGHIYQFFKSNDGQRYYKNELMNNEGYWFLKKTKLEKGLKVGL